MDLKSAVYAILAVALGYILISVVPNHLVGLERGMSPVMAPAEEFSEFSVDEENLKKAEGDQALESVEGGQPLEGIEPWHSRGGVREGAFSIGVWMVDLLIALGVYVIVKRRLS